MPLKHTVLSSTLERVRVEYLTRDAARWWNEHRKADDTPLFCGWYWSHLNEEAGPFKTYSACVANAHYRFVLHRTPPRIHQPRPRRKLRLVA